MTGSRCQHTAKFVTTGYKRNRIRSTHGAERWAHVALAASVRSILRRSRFLAHRFSSGFTDGTYAYFVPDFNGVSYHSNLVRVALNDFSSSGVSFLNLADTNTNLNG